MAIAHEAVQVELEPLQLIAPDGSPTDHPDHDLIALHDRLPALYELMVATRGLDEEFVNLQRQGQLALYPSCEGQEAAQVGAVAALRDTDWLFPQYRELGAFLVRGVDPGGIGLTWRGTVHGGIGLVEKHIAPIAISIGTHSLHAAGAAMASTWLGDEGVTVAFIGDGATSQGDVHEAMNLAAVHAAPCIFYVQNNGWAISTPVEDQFRAPSIAHKAMSYGMRGVRVDGNDVAACFYATQAAAERARRGEGPTLVEAVTYRLGPHTTADDPTRYRSEDELAAWRERDPIDRLRSYLQRVGIWDDALEEASLTRMRELRVHLREAVVDAEDRPMDEVFDVAYGEPTPALVAQRDELRTELARGA